MTIDTNAHLRPLASERQLTYLDAIVQEGTQAAAARALGINQRTLERALKSLRAKYARTDAMHMPADIPEGYAIKGTSTLVDGDGNAKLRWIKTHEDREALSEALTAMVEELTEDIRGVATPTAGGVEEHEDDLAVVYPWGDPHLGMYAWAEEAGGDFDIAIAERDLEEAMATLVERAPASEVGILLNLGDFFHADNQSNMTTRSGHILDVDTRWSQTMKVGVRLMVKCIRFMLLKHKTVLVRNVRGNHDDHSAMALSLILDAYFENEPRVEIDTSPAEVWYYRFGSTLIGATHGDKIKASKLPGLMAFDRKEDWAASDYRYWYCGHVHHREERANEESGVTVEYFRTLAERDVYTQSSGYRAGKDIRYIVLHRDWGEVERHTLDIRRIRSQQ